MLLSLIIVPWRDLLLLDVFIIIPDDIISSIIIVANVGTATVSSSDSETVFFNFNAALLASDVSIMRIRGRCEDGTQEMFWNYQPNFNISFVASCDNSSYEFQALSSGDIPIGFSFTIQVNSPTTMSELIHFPLYVHYIIMCSTLVLP